MGTPFEAFKDLPEGLHIAIEGGPADRPATSLRDLVLLLLTLSAVLRVIVYAKGILQQC